MPEFKQINQINQIMFLNEVNYQQLPMQANFYANYTPASAQPPGFFKNGSTTCYFHCNGRQSMVCVCVRLHAYRYMLHAVAIQLYIEKPQKKICNCEKGKANSQLYSSSQVFSHTLNLGETLQLMGRILIVTSNFKISGEAYIRVPTTQLASQLDCQLTGYLWSCVSYTQQPRVAIASLLSNYDCQLANYSYYMHA